MAAKTSSPAFLKPRWVCSKEGPTPAHRLRATKEGRENIRGGGRARVERGKETEYNGPHKNAVASQPLYSLWILKMYHPHFIVLKSCFNFILFLLAPQLRSVNDRNVSFDVVNVKWVFLCSSPLHTGREKKMATQFVLASITKQIITLSLSISPPTRFLGKTVQGKK